MRRKCDISSGPRSGGLATMIADPKASESKAKTIAGQLPNRRPMRNRALGAASSSCTEARYCIRSPQSDARPMIWPKRYSRKAHLTPPTRRIVGKTAVSPHFTHGALRRQLLLRTGACQKSRVAPCVATSRRAIQFSDGDRDRIESGSVSRTRDVRAIQREISGGDEAVPEGVVSTRECL